MKKVIFGSMMMLTGLLSAAVLLGGAMACDWTSNGQLSAIWNLKQYGLMPAVWLFGIIGVIGAAIAVWGLADRKD